MSTVLAGQVLMNPNSFFCFYKKDHIITILISVGCLLNSCSVSLIPPISSQKNIFNSHSGSNSSNAVVHEAHIHTTRYNTHWQISPVAMDNWDGNNAMGIIMQEEQEQEIAKSASVLSCRCMQM